MYLAIVSSSRNAQLTIERDRIGLLCYGQIESLLSEQYFSVDYPITDTQSSAAPAHWPPCIQPFSCGRQHDSFGHLARIGSQARHDERRGTRLPWSTFGARLYPEKGSLDSSAQEDDTDHSDGDRAFHGVDRLRDLRLLGDNSLVWSDPEVHICRAHDGVVGDRSRRQIGVRNQREGYWPTDWLGGVCFGVDGQRVDGSAHLDLWNHELGRNVERKQI